MKTPVRGYAARRRFLGLNPAGVTAIVVGVVLVGLWMFGVFDPLSKMLFAPREPSHRGQVAIPVSAVGIPAYTRITRDHLWSAKEGNFAVIYLRPDQVTPEIIRNSTNVFGRIMDHDKPPGYVFTEADFLPRGTRPGLVAGIPAGKRAMRVPVEKIPGLVGLLPGDRFDLISTMPIDVGGASAMTAGGGMYGKQLDLQARMTNWQKQATVRVIVQSGDVVQPVTTRQIPVATNTMTSGLIVRTKPIQEVVIAVSPYEVAHLTEALAIGAELSCVPRSGRPDDPRDSITPESSPFSPFGGTTMQRPSGRASSSSSSAAEPSVSPSSPTPPPGMFGAGFTSIETISGTKREIVATPVKR